MVAKEMQQLQRQPYHPCDNHSVAPTLLAKRLSLHSRRLLLQQLLQRIIIRCG
jgi:hypothetical protein